MRGLVMKGCATSVLLLAVAACATGAPESFMERTSLVEAYEEAGWVLIALRDGVPV